MVISIDEKRRIRKEYNQIYHKKHKKRISLHQKNKYLKDKISADNKCSECGDLISLKVNLCAKCCKKGDRNPAKKQSVRDKISKTMKSPEKRGQVMKMQKAGVEAIKKLSLKKFLEGNPTLKIGKRGYLMIYIPELSDYKFKKDWRYYHHYIWETLHQRELPKGYCIHHKDRNKLNNLIGNLQLMTIKEHDQIPQKSKKS